MLNWFALRLKEAQEKDKTGQGGFTLIELLVVVIIIGILAAIAIPVFLNQRNKAYDSAAQSDVKNMATAQETYYAGQNKYAADYTTLKTDQKLVESQNVTDHATTAVNTAGNYSFCVSAKSDSGQIFKAQSGTGGKVAKDTAGC